MNLRQLEVFRAVMLTGGVSAAAQMLHVSQPAVSKVLAQAARQSGLVLFERVKGRLVPTPEARQLYAEVEALWRGVEKVRDFSRELAQPRSGTLRLAVTASLAPSLVPLAVARLTRRFPGFHCRVDVLVPSLLTEALLGRSAHLGVALLPNDHPNVVQEASYRCGLCCVMPPEHPLAARRAIAPADLRGARLVSSPADTPYGQVLRRAYGPGRESLRIDIEVRSATAASWFVRAGAGIALVDAASVAGGAVTGLVVRPFRTDEQLDVAILRNLHFPLSVIETAFVTAFDEAWDEVFGARRRAGTRPRADARSGVDARPRVDARATGSSPRRSARLARLPA
jgi:DNA-binding transcriptional LysR family regulator